MILVNQICDVYDAKLWATSEKIRWNSTMSDLFYTLIPCSFLSSLCPFLPLSFRSLPSLLCIPFAIPFKLT